MDIQYLLWLQNIRQQLGEGISSLACVVSDVPVSFLAVLICALIYWCLDRETGLYLMTNVTLGRALNQVIKNTVCMFRPWVRDARVIPPSRALKSATGYSFPSGHSQIAASVYGGLAWRIRRQRKWIAVICLMLVLAVAFSRNYLGVHTPQDVGMALLEAVLVLYVTEKIFSSVKKAQEAAVRENGSRRASRMEWMLLASGIILSAALVLYILIKPYPSGIVDGEQIVDPEKMRLDAFDGAGYLMGLSLGWFLERRLVHTAVTWPSGDWKGRIPCGIAGTGILAACNYGLFPLLRRFLDGRMYKFFYGFSLYVLILFLIPWIFRRAVGRHSM